MSAVGSASVANYRLLAQLGSGGMADVHLAVDNRLAVSKLVVLKRVRSHLAEDAEFRALLLEEARVCARLNHPNIVQVFDVGFEDGECFLAMEYLDGQSLSQVVKQVKKKLSLDVELLIVSDVLRALHYAHTLTDFDGTPLAIVHRDVSPQNIFVTYDGAVKLLDFGIAKAAGRATETRQGFMRGKVRYMAPEQITGLEVDRRYDVFAAGILVWQAVTDRRFWGDLPDPFIMKKLADHDFQTSPRLVRSDVPPALDAICNRALAPDRERRYPTAGAMLADLEDYLGDRIVDLRRELIAVLKETFAEDRLKRRAVMEEVAATTSIATTLGKIALKTTSSRTADSLASQALVSAQPAGTGFNEETQSLANLLEPSLTRLRRDTPRPRSRWRTAASIGLAILLLGIASTIAFVRRGNAQATRTAATTTDDKVDVVNASDDVVLAHSAVDPSASTAPPAPAASASASPPASSAVAKAAPSRPTRRYFRTPAAPSGTKVVVPSAPATSTSSTKPSPAKPTMDTSDPWH